MSYGAYGNAITRIRELLTGGYGQLRTITSTRLQGDLPDGLSDGELARRGSFAEIPIRVVLTGLRPHQHRILETGSVQLWYLDVEVHVVRTFDVGVELNDDQSDAIRALAMEDAEAIAQVLQWPFNLTVTQAGGQTGLLDIRFKDTLDASVTGDAGEAQTLRTRFKLEGTIKSSPAVV